jgi:hypothetical protein
MTVEGYNEEIGGTAISRSIWTWARPAGGAACGAGGGAPVPGRRTPALRALGAFRPGLKESTMHLPGPTIRTQVMLPLRFADGFGTTARV